MSVEDSPPLDILLVHDGRAGHANQVRGLGDAVARIRPARLIEWDTEKNAAAPWKTADLLLACGRRALGPALRFARRAGGRAFKVALQNPGRLRSRFDLTIAPRHDGLEGEALLETVGPVHRVTPEACAKDAAALIEAGVALPSARRCAFLFGGATKKAKLDNATLERWIAAASAVREAGFGLLLTASRRTGAAAERRLRGAIKGENVLFWDGRPLGPLANPYGAFLGLAEHVVVTTDSAAMAAEAASAGPSVHLLAGPDGRRKFKRLGQDLIARGVARAFTPPPWGPPLAPPLGETARAAHEVLRRFSAHEAPRA